jgi:hypothetical protein
LIGNKKSSRVGKTGELSAFLKGKILLPVAGRRCYLLKRCEGLKIKVPRSRPGELFLSLTKQNYLNMLYLLN